MQLPKTKTINKILLLISCYLFAIGLFFFLGRIEKTLNILAGATGLQVEELKKQRQLQRSDFIYRICGNRGGGIEYGQDGSVRVVCNRERTEHDFRFYLENEGDAQTL